MRKAVTRGMLHAIGIPTILAMTVALGCGGLNPIYTSAPSDSAPMDCGVNSLILLSSLESRPISLQGIEAVLPPRHPEGYSMAELVSAAAGRGLKLQGMRLGRDSPPLDRPAIAFMQDSRHGHFLVLRPVGTTNTMIQIIDPPHAPRVVEYTDLVRMPAWTGKLLVRAEPWPIRHALPLLVGFVGLVLLSTTVIYCNMMRKQATRRTMPT